MTLFDNKDTFNYVKYNEETRNTNDIGFSIEKLHRNNEYYIHIINSCGKITDFNFLNNFVENIHILDFKCENNNEKQELLNIFNNKFQNVKINLIKIND